ncbi:protein FAM166B-like [Ornithorhynchus anatinus]|uniref:protein FAM166B-like n=1 Tax=Ornithorhynchus anatinus TaxID=9258 RepID=UPI0019D43EF0|nr:protein FAM166B-like [Ornithorhynchus anatinus]
MEQNAPPAPAPLRPSRPAGAPAGETLSRERGAMAGSFPPGLTRPNRHHIPGYSGHCPQLRFSLGHTYGHLTARLLRDPPAPARPPTRYVLLAPTQPPRSPDLPRKERLSWHGHERLSCSLVPGYTGFVPRARPIFAKSYSRVCAQALSEFTHQGVRPREQTGVLKSQPPTAECEPTSPRDSPYSRENRDPGKGFVSGFTGFVPGARFLFGSGFPVLTDRALREFRRLGPRKGHAELFPPLDSTYPRALAVPPHSRGPVPGEGPAA